MNKSQKAALFVFLSLLASLIAAAALYFTYAGTTATAVPLLIGCVLVAFLLILAAARTVAGFRRSRQLSERHQVPPSKTLHVMDLRQWLTLILGITVVAIGTGAFTGVRILAGPAGETTVVLPSNPAIAPPVTTEPTPSPIETITEPTESPTPTEPSDPTPSPGESTDPNPAATKYLDTEDPIEGGYSAEAVAFSAQRHIRGVKFYCNRATNSVLQWNVAGMARFSATAGIDDTTDNTFGKVVEFLFYDEDGNKLGKTVEVSVGHPKEIELALNGVSSLRMTCATHDSKTNEERDTYAALGDPFVSAT